MKYVTSIAARWPMATLLAVTLSFLVIGTASSAGVTPAAYFLQGDAANSSAGNTSFTSPSSGEPWKFAATGSSGTAVVGECLTGTACWGVQGRGTAIGVYGTGTNLTSSAAAGVQGAGGSTATSGISYGGFFTATNSASGGKAYGVYGSGANAGLYGASDSGNGVNATSTYAEGNGVYATGSGSNFYGVWGSVTGNGYGIVGTSSGGIGSYGTTTGSTTAGVLTAGTDGYNSLSAVGSTSSVNSGAYGACPNCNGVFGTSANYIGVRGTATGTGSTTYGGYFTSRRGTGVYASTKNGQTAFRASNGVKDSSHYAGIFDGNVRINGNYVATGTKSAVVETSEGDKLMYAEEATQNYFSDQGQATLKHGRLVVKLDSLFAQTVDLTKPYMVIVTPMSFDTTGLGVGNLKAKSFEVRELNGGKGNVTFSWRVTALRKGYTDARMATAPGDPDSTIGALPTTPSSSDTPVTDPSVAPPTLKKAPALFQGIVPLQVK